MARGTEVIGPWIEVIGPVDRGHWPVDRGQWREEASWFIKRRVALDVREEIHLQSSKGSLLTLQMLVIWTLSYHVSTEAGYL